MLAKKIKIIFYINNFRVPIPSMRFKTIKLFLRCALKYMDQKEMNKELFNEYLQELLKMLSQSEPFELINAEIMSNGKKYKILIITK